MATGSLIAVSRISIHAPARGATIDVEIHTVATKDFNPRPREGGDLPDAEVSFLTGISIHAPARGATFADQFLWYCCVYFNPRPREGGDLAFYPSFPLKKYFNPRPREGGDSKDAQFYLRIFDKQVELLRFWGKMRGGCLRNPEKDRRFLGKSLANLPEISGHLDFAGA